MPKLINYPHLASQAFGVPLYVTQEVLAGVKSLLMPRMLGSQQEVMAGDDLPDGFEPKPLEVRGESRYRIEGLAVIRCMASWWPGEAKLTTPAPSSPATSGRGRRLLPPWLTNGSRR